VVVGPVDAGVDVDDGTVVVDDVVVVIGNVKLGGVGLVSGSPLLQAAATSDATPRPITQHAGRAIRSSCRTTTAFWCHSPRNVPPSTDGAMIGRMEIRRQIVVFDAADLGSESAFWAGVLGGHVVPDDDEGWHSVVDADGRWRMGVQRAPGHVPPDWPNGAPQQIHLDLHVDDVEAARAAHDEIVALGARLLWAGDTDAPEGHRVYADPAGHPFCIGWGH
jgi:hypothetical protein